MVGQELPSRSRNPLKPSSRVERMPSQYSSGKEAQNQGYYGH